MVEKKWYHYWRGGHVERIVTEAGTAPDEYFVEHFQHNGAQQMWLYRTYTCEADPNSCNGGGLDCAPINVVGLSAWEFRYAGDRQRYMVRERDPEIPDWSDPNHPPYLEPVSTRWHDYVGDSVHTDFAMVLDDPNNPLAEVTARYHHGGVGAGGRQPADGSLVAMDGGGGFYGLGDRRFFHGDMLGTTRMLTNCAGQGGQMSGQPARMTFTAFGEPLGDALASCPRYGYCGAWGYQTGRTTTSGDPNAFVPPNGLLGLAGVNPNLPPITLQHVGARWYDPGLGRFIQRDPIGLAGGLNVYAYCDGEPVAGLDPSGLSNKSTYRPRPRIPRRKQPAPPWSPIPDTPYGEYNPQSIPEAAACIREIWFGVPIGERQFDPPRPRTWCPKHGFDCPGHIEADGPWNHPPKPAPRPEPGWPWWWGPRGGFPGFCFVEGTPIAASGGAVPIEAIRPGESVCGKSDGGARIAAVERVHTAWSSIIVSVDLGCETLRCTPAHPFWVAGAGWVPAAQLQAGDELYNADGDVVAVRAVWVERLSQAVKVFNLTVGGDHTYFVGELRVLVHNKQ